MHAFGIDFGTTNSVVALATESTVDTIPLDDQLPPEWAGTGFDRVLPSVIGFEGSTPSFGWPAKLRRGNRLEAVKRLFATDDTVTIGGNELKVEEAAAIFFRHLQHRTAAAGLTTRLDRAVVTIPANSRGLARYRTKLSAGLAGIEVLALINEPTAAAMAHARVIGQNQRILVFDWGGGTLDVTVLQSFEGTFIEQSSKGIQRLGGLDIDRALSDAILPRVPGSAGWRDEELTEFRLHLERAKVALSSAPSAHVSLPGGGTYEVTRGHFEEVVWPLVQRTREPVDVCLRESPGRIDHLVMVGGSTKMPIVRKFLTDLVGTEPGEDVDPMTAIAEGAAIAAGILQGIITDLDFHVGTEHALGTVVHNDPGVPDGEFSVLIPRNTKYPARAGDVYAPATDFQERVGIEVIEGDPVKPIHDEDNVILKKWEIELPEKRSAVDSAFDITYEYDVDGILHVLVTDRKTRLVMMDEELAFGAAQDRSQLPRMRRRVDDLMAVPTPTPTPDLAADGPASPEVVAAVRKATDRVIPFVGDTDRDLLETLVAQLRSAEPAEEPARLDALQRELRNHAYLL